MYSLIKKLALVSGVSGHEKNIADTIRGEISAAVDECRIDALGNLIALKRGSAPDGERKKILLCAHMDEIGFMVTFIESNGQIRVAPIGGINYIAASYNEVKFENGVRGVLVAETGTKADQLTPDKFYVEIGASSAAEAGRRVAVGDCLSVLPHLTRLGSNRISGRPLDDRVGCAIIIEIARRLAGGCRDDIYYVFSVQEEVGCRGARTAGFAVAPDIALAFDVTGTGDTPGAKPMACKLGGGAAIKIKDSSVICSDDVVSALEDIAAEKKIRHQFEILTAGGTDTSSLQAAGAGCRAGGISVPTRYIHSGVETLDLRDVEAAVELTVAYLTSSHD